MRLASRSHAPLDSPNQGVSPPPKQLLWIQGIESESGTCFAGISIRKGNSEVMHLLLAFNAGKLNPPTTLTPVYNVAQLALALLLGGGDIAQYLPYQVVYVPHRGALDAHAFASF